MSLSFFSDMPSVHFDCLSKAFAKTTGHFFWGGDQPTQGYKPFIYKPKGVSHISLITEIGWNQPRHQMPWKWTPGRANGSFGVPVCSESQENGIAGLAGSLEMSPLPGCRGTENKACLALEGGDRAAQLGVHSFCSLVFWGQQCGDSLPLHLLMCEFLGTSASLL